MNENGNLILKNEEIAKTFDDYFSEIVDNLNLHHWQDKTSPLSSTSDKINDIKKNYEKHPTICNIKTKHRHIINFSFPPVSAEEVKKIIQDLKTNKAVGGEISTSKLKECKFTFDVLINCIINLLKLDIFQKA